MLALSYIKLTPWICLEEVATRDFVVPITSVDRDRCRLCFLWFWRLGSCQRATKSPCTGNHRCRYKSRNQFPICLDLQNKVCIWIIYVTYHQSAEDNVRTCSSSLPSSPSSSPPPPPPPTSYWKESFCRALPVLILLSVCFASCV